MFLLIPYFVAILAMLSTAAVFCWRDARYRGKSPLAVVGLVLFTFPVGLVAWLVFRPDPQPPSTRREKFELDNYRLQ